MHNQSDIATSMMLAVIASSDTPLLLLDGNLVVIAASASFGHAFGIDPAGMPDRLLAELGDGEWNVPQLKSLLRATAAGPTEVEAYEMDLNREDQLPRRLVIKARKLDYSDTANVRLMLLVSDVTDFRLAEKLKDNLLREKAILLQELQHRVANSLQIIASVLMQSAKKVKSEESRGHLHDAHNRVMSVATMQQQLTASTLGEVKLRPYFTSLCDSIGASMIRDPHQLSLTVETDESATSADISVSLGLIVTELVINALKHAFPGHRRGKIMVDYHTQGPEWTLSVSDDGVGLPQDAASAKPGLGTSIVGALATQLDAKVHMVGKNPGTSVFVIHAKETLVPA